MFLGTTILAFIFNVRVAKIWAVEVVLECVLKY